MRRYEPEDKRKKKGKKRKRKRKRRKKKGIQKKTGQQRGTGKKNVTERAGSGSILIVYDGDDGKSKLEDGRNAGKRREIWNG